MADEVQEQEQTQDEKVEWGYLDVRAFQVKGWKPGENGERVSANMSEEICNPYHNEEQDKNFYHVRMNDGATFERGGEKIDLSGYTTTINAKCVRKSEKFPGSVGLSYTKDAEIRFKKDELNQETHEWEQVGNETVSLAEAQAAVKASVEAYKLNREKNVNWDYLNVNSFQVQGVKQDAEGKTKFANLADPECQPIKNPKNGSQFYRVRMNKGATFERDGKTVDISDYSTTVPAKCVHPSDKYPGKCGISFPEDAEIAFSKTVKVDGVPKIENKETMSLGEAQAAQHASVMAFKQTKEQEQAQKQDEPKAGKEKHTIANVAKKAKAKAAKAGEKKEEAQTQSKSKTKTQTK